jgi:hypothetical protein
MVSSQRVCFSSGTSDSPSAMGTPVISNGAVPERLSCAERMSDTERFWRQGKDRQDDMGVCE